MTENKFIFNDVEKNYNEQWKEEILPKLIETLGDRNVMSMPKLSTITVNIKINSVKSKDKAYLQAVERDLTLLSGQKSSFRKAKKSVASFKLREGQIVGAKVTLRRNKMKSFFSVLRDIVIPSLREFRGLPKNFDKRGGYNLSIFNHDIFPGININDVKDIFKVGVNFSMKNVTNQTEGYALLKAYGLPFVSKRG